MREYASKFNLNILHSSTLVGSSFNKAKGVWNAKIRTPFGIKTLRAKQLVQATGVGCDHPYIPKLPGKESYKGVTNFHSKEYKNPRQLLDKGSKASLSPCAKRPGTRWLTNQLAVCNCCRRRELGL